ncbi:phosphatidylinositol-glycan biosynthesis class S protein-domain-containing protein [Rhodofomes roseus]|uniref:Phosphatidylinositol-glycan biosynthesis class S protein-domain-containing protein n=1 Tax=Rhodofomes roseus TaxID=34475 RepID=A0ABQ8KFZ6_9APHY|nr:phosphatidylinositol-glycan biosynthesis class S protein-domain-containing protein [Rhodofomes roseus]KAH9836162.1 phosphatidylinositol-glycan biosynthesis class S protein-domain-containing protein [Rhodofomes roseus]
MDAVSKPALAFESAFTRRSIIASYFLVIFLALPLWWKTTSIERQALPVSRVYAATGRELAFPIHVALDTRNCEVGTDTIVQEVRHHVENNGEFKQNGLSVEVSSATATANDYQVVLRPGTRDPIVDGRKVTVEVAPEHAGVAALQLADTLATLLTPYTSLRSSQAERVVTYSPRYRLAFTLLNEDAAAGNAALSWDVQNALAAQLSPLLERLSVLHNFTIESQVQYHGPLAFEPRALQVGEQIEHGLTPGDLTVFVNSAEWTLSSSVSNDPVLHFVAFIPSSKHSPLRIVDSNGLPTSSNAFILPQWGGIIIHNPQSTGIVPTLAGRPLDTIFATFRQQLSALLGVPELPPHVHARTRGVAGVTDWQLDALVRRRAAENAASAQDTLQSIVRLVAQIEDMPVGEDVKGDVQDALAALDQAYSTAPSSSTEALTFASKAQSVASRAFFNPGMLALLYFPTEHKWAVYAPLFASVTAPLLASLIREVLAWKKERKAKARGPQPVDSQRPKAE